jgi:hypothetical protein
LTTDAGGTTQVKGNVTTIGSQTYGDAVTIANNPIISGSRVTFNDTVNGTSDLTVNAVSGNIAFNGAVGNTTALGNITANSTATTTFNAVNSSSVTTDAGGTNQLNGNVTTTGSQTMEMLSQLPLIRFCQAAALLLIILLTPITLAAT